MKKTSVKITTIGGGSGQFALLSGLKSLKKTELTAIVSMADSGGSTGRLRDELGVLPPGDILKCIVALSPFQDVARKILQTKLDGHSRLSGHNAGNMLLSMLSQYAGSFPAGVESLGDLLNIRGQVFPVTTDKATLVAELIDGSRLYGESAIDIPQDRPRKKIKDVYLVPHHSELIKVFPPVLEAIEKADYIIIGPGDLYTSIVPNFLVPGVVTAVKLSKAKLIYIVNAMTKFGETDHFSPVDFVKKIEKYIGRRLDYVLINTAKPPQEILKRYQKQRASFVELKDQYKEKIKPRKIIKGDLIESGEIVRHSPVKLTQAIEKIIRK